MGTTTTRRVAVTAAAGGGPSRRGAEDPAWVRWLLVGACVAFAGVFLVLPLANVFVQALAKGWRASVGSLAHPDTVESFKLTALVTAVCVPVNTVFGVAAAWLVARFEFRGKALLVTWIDLPFSVSPVVTGMLFVLLFGLRGYLGPWLDARDVQVIFATPGIVLATLFVTVPFVARELIPVMQAQGSDAEQAALTLGASGWQAFWHVTLPSIKWGLLYGVILCNARAVGEFGAVAVVSGRVSGVTDTVPLRIEKLDNEYNPVAAFTLAALLALLALATLGIKTWLEHRQQVELARAQEPMESTDEH
jgi:sulfate transport system permease protein